MTSRTSGNDNLDAILTHIVSGPKDVGSVPEVCHGVQRDQEGQRGGSVAQYEQLPRVHAQGESEQGCADPEVEEIFKQHAVSRAHEPARRPGR